MSKKPRPVDSIRDKDPQLSSGSITGVLVINDESVSFNDAL